MEPTAAVQAAESPTKSAYPVMVVPIRFRKLGAHRCVAVSPTGDFAFLTPELLSALRLGNPPHDLQLLAELKSKFILQTPQSVAYARLLASRLAAKTQTLTDGPALHIIVPTLKCAHSCPYCQVSRSLSDDGCTMSPTHLDAACDTIFQSRASALTVEFQGGDPLLRFDLIRRAIDRIASRAQTAHSHVRFVIASTLHQLTVEMCAYLRAHNVFLSTSIDGPAELHNRNRPTPTSDSFQRTVAGIAIARELIGPDSVSALMTTTRLSLSQPEAIIDTYVELGLHEVFIRPMAPYGFATRSRAKLGYERDAFRAFYRRALERVVHWNQRGYELREVWASIILNKVMSPFDGGYVDLQSPTGAGRAVVVYNYDGLVYPSDEARMIAESGDKSLALGRIGDPLDQLLKSEVQKQLTANSLTDAFECRDCAYSPYCGPDPVAAYAQHGSMATPTSATLHCQDSLWLFDYLFGRLSFGDESFERLAHRWAQPSSTDDAKLPR
jgi:His-Xaa-Ser system radical SAM maturase HxsB